MTRGRLKANRLHAVEQAALVWCMIDEDTSGEHLQEFVETGELAATPDVTPYNPLVMEELAKNWTW